VTAPSDIEAWAEQQHELIDEAARQRFDRRCGCAHGGEAVKELEHCLKAVVHCQAARAMADDLPGRDEDPDADDTQVETMQGVVHAARSNLEAHFGRSMRRGSGSGPSGPSGTDHDKPYDDAAGGDDLERARTAIRNADAEADNVVTAVGDDAAVDAAASEMHFHVKEADAALERYRDVVVNNP
jgi:hypothetical protein